MDRDYRQDCYAEMDRKTDIILGLMIVGRMARALVLGPSDVLRSQLVELY